MNILMLSDVYFPRVNGVSTSIKTFTHALRKAGHRVILVAPDYESSSLVYHDCKENIYRVPARHLIGDVEDRLLRGEFFDELLEALRQESIDIIHIHTPFRAHYWGIRLARELNCACTATYHTYFEEYLHHYIPMVPRRWLRALARRFTVSQSQQVDKLVVPSTAMQELLQVYGVEKEMTVIPTGLKLSHIGEGDGKKFRLTHSIEADRPVIGHIGRVAHEKNIVFLLDVLKDLKKTIPNILLVIAGEGPAKKSLMRRAVRAGLAKHIMFVGYLSREHELWDCYAAADVFVFSSRTETQGLVLLEAMATGVPVVSTAVLGTKDILAPQRGALIADDNVQDFGDKVRLLLSNQLLRDNLGQEGKSYVNEWSDVEMAARMAEHYNEVMQQYAERNLATGSAVPESAQ